VASAYSGTLKINPEAIINPAMDARLRKRCVDRRLNPILAVAQIWRAREVKLENNFIHILSSFR
jgi:hypothetical protein